MRIRFSISDSFKYYLKAVANIGLMFIIGLNASASYDTDDPDPMELELDRNIEIPEIPASRTEQIVEASKHLRDQFKNHGLSVGLIRENEVVMISIPCSRLFAANSTELTPGGKKTLNLFKDVVASPDLYKILVAVHTDDTGDEDYSYILSESRANAIDDYLSIFGGKASNIIPYGMGFDQPIKDNNSIANRQTNRRVEFYLVPEIGWIK